jgi:hypothetical protein
VLSPALAAGARPVSAPTPPPRRWECGCQQPPVLLATYEAATGTVHLKVRDRYYHIEGGKRLVATCPRCGRSQTLNLPVMRDA